jgi:hypothetical protein
MPDDIRIQSMVSALDRLKDNDTDTRMAGKKRRQAKSKAKAAVSSGDGREEGQEHKLDIQV